MLYLDDKDFNSFEIDWLSTVDLVSDVVKTLNSGDFSQPIKSYLRYYDPKNRIISMPAFLGGEFNITGIKWISSFPDNHHVNLPRAHSVVIINNAKTGKPIGIINTPQLSAIRTASVSGLMIYNFNKVRKLNNAKIGIIGWGPIGQYHLKMCYELLKENISNVYIFDIKTVDKSTINFFDKGKIAITSTWEKAYNEADILITSTVSIKPYIDKKPKDGSLHLNVSLRDYKTSIYEYFKNSIIVDNWEEVCRENTNIEQMAMEKELRKEDTLSIIDVVVNRCMEKYSKNTPIMFNPMGLAVFDIAFGDYFLNKAGKTEIGQTL